MQDPFVAAMLRVAQQHYGGNLGAGAGANWLHRMAYNPTTNANPLARRLIGLLGNSDPRAIMGMRPNTIPTDYVS